MNVPVLFACGLLLAAAPALAGDPVEPYDTQMDHTDIDQSDVDTHGMDGSLSSEGLSQGNDFSDMDPQVDWSDTNPKQDTNDLDVPPTPEPEGVPTKYPQAATPVPSELQTSDKWPAADLPPDPTPGLAE